METDNLNAYVMAHREAEAAGLGTLIVTGNRFDWVATRAGSTASPRAELAHAARLMRAAQDRVRDLVKRDHRNGDSLATIATRSGLSIKAVRTMLAST